MDNERIIDPLGERIDKYTIFVEIKLQDGNIDNAIGDAIENAKVKIEHLPTNNN